MSSATKVTKTATSAHGNTFSQQRAGVQNDIKTHFAQR